jgi:pimeloyl-ACP methyl ester carboxylesterase
MGGGEVARYFSRYGGARVSKVVLISTVLPYLLKTEDNPDGVDAAVFEDMMNYMTQDRPAFLQEFGKTFFGVGMLSKPVSNGILQNHFMLALAASGRATRQCAISFSQTDFRQDVAAINVPALVIHGSGDNIVPIQASSDRTASMIPDSIYKVYDDAPHGLFISEKDRLNQDLIEFING